MIKVDIVNEVSKVADITKVKAEVAVDAVFDAMRLSMQRGERIELRGFGVFQVKPRKRGIGRNPRTGKEVRIPPGRTIRFKPGKDLQNIQGIGARSSIVFRPFQFLPPSGTSRDPAGMGSAAGRARGERPSAASRSRLVARPAVRAHHRNHRRGRGRPLRLVHWRSGGG